jgi:hypothetical protein
MTEQVTLEGFPGRRAYVFPIKRLHKLYYLAYAVYRSNATGQVDKKSSVHYPGTRTTDREQHEIKSGPFQPYP